MAVTDLTALSAMLSGTTPWGDNMRGAMNTIIERLDRTVTIPAITGSVSLNWGLGNSFKVEATGDIGPFTATNATVDRVGQIQITNTSVGTINIDWTGFILAGSPPATLAADGVLWATIGLVI